MFVIINGKFIVYVNMILIFNRSFILELFVFIEFFRFCRVGKLGL